MKAFVAANKYIYEETKSKPVDDRIDVVKAVKGLLKQKVDFGF